MNSLGGLGQPLCCWMFLIIFVPSICSNPPAQCPRSADQLLLEVLRSKRKIRREKAFAVAAPELWNAWTLHIRPAPSLSIFKTRVQNHFYSPTFNPTWVSFLILLYSICFNVVLLLYILCSVLFKLFYSMLGFFLCSGVLWLKSSRNKVELSWNEKAKNDSDQSW